MEPIRFNLISRKCEGVFGVSEGKHLREKSKKGYKEIIDVACLELLNKSK